MLRCALLASIALLPMTAHALQRPDPAIPAGQPGSDPHVRVATYQPSEQILLIGAVSRPMTIEFCPNERILRAILPAAMRQEGDQRPGDATSPWATPTAQEVDKVPLLNVLPLWPLVPGRSSMQVQTTLGDEPPRIYTFALRALEPQPDECVGSDDCDDPRIITKLTFKCEPEKKKPDPAVIAASAARREARLRLEAQDRLKVDIFSGTPNKNYEPKGSEEAVRELAPDLIFDNTQITGLRYSGNRKVPTIYVRDGPKLWRQVNPTPQGAILVIGETASALKLRRNPYVIEIENLGYNPSGYNPHTGTTSPNVIRVTKKPTG
jgi:type IV secretion system protein VirB9